MFDIAALKSVLPLWVTMKANTATAFVLAGVALWLVRPERAYPWRQRLGQLCACARGLLAAVGYMYDITALFTIGTFTGMAVHTTVTFIVLSGGILGARPDRGMMAVLTRDSVGGVMARRVVPAAIGIPLVLGWLRWEG